MTARTIKKTVQGIATQDGAGVKLVRVIGHADVRDFDPFLMLDAFDSKNPADYTQGFPFHPHRGIETVTYLISGCIEHRDSMGNKGTISDGSCQWMTAGSGVIHQEMPKAAPHMLGLQLWINLPQKDKMAEPAYRDLQSAKIPKVVKDNATVGIISGSYDGVSSSFTGEYVKTLLLDVDLKADSEWTLPVPKEDTVFLYVVDGAARFEEGGKLTGAKNAVLLSDGDTVRVRTGKDEGVRFVLFSAKPLKEDVAWGGPIVMNTREELHHAFAEISDGTFVKHARPEQK